MCIVDSHHHLIALFKYFNVLWLPDPQGPFSEMVPSMLIIQRARLPKKVKGNRERLAERHMHHKKYMATPEEKQIDTHLKMEWQMHFSENLPGIIQWWWTTKWDIIRIGQWGSCVARPTAFSIICGNSKMENAALTC